MEEAPRVERSAHQFDEIREDVKGFELLWRGLGCFGVILCVGLFLGGLGPGRCLRLLCS